MFGIECGMEMGHLSSVGAVSTPGSVTDSESRHDWDLYAHSHSKPARHGTTNRVYLDPLCGVVTKAHAEPGDEGMWRSPAREAAAVRILARRQYVPALLSADSGGVQLAHVSGLPYPEAFASLDHSDRVALAYRAGAVLRDIHGHRPPTRTAPPWTTLWMPNDRPPARWKEAVGGLVRTLSERLALVRPHLAATLSRLREAAELWVTGLADPDYRLVHGDFGGANLLVTRAGDIVVLDWEWSHVGDSYFDIARHHWLRQVGLDHRLYDDSATTTAFFEGYGDPGLATAEPNRLRAYGALWALGHALVAVRAGRTTAPFELWLVAAAWRDTG